MLELGLAELGRSSRLSPPGHKSATAGFWGPNRRESQPPRIFRVVNLAGIKSQIDSFNLAVSICRRVVRHNTSQVFAICEIQCGVQSQIDSLIESQMQVLAQIVMNAIQC